MSELPVYDGVTQPDFAGPHQFFSRTPDLDIRVALLGGQSITADRLSSRPSAAVVGWVAKCLPKRAHPSDVNGVDGAVS